MKLSQLKVIRVKDNISPKLDKLFEDHRRGSKVILIAMYSFYPNDV